MNVQRENLRFQVRMLEQSKSSAERAELEQEIASLKAENSLELSCACRDSKRRTSSLPRFPCNRKFHTQKALHEHKLICKMTLGTSVKEDNDHQQHHSSRHRLNVFYHVWVSVNNY
eukprot:5094718-Amphidinium_carterae.1